MSPVVCIFKFLFVHFDIYESFSSVQQQLDFVQLKFCDLLSNSRLSLKKSFYGVLSHFQQAIQSKRHFQFNFNVQQFYRLKSGHKQETYNNQTCISLGFFTYLTIF